MQTNYLGCDGQDQDGLMNNFWISQSNLGEKSFCSEDEPREDYRSVGPFGSRPYWSDSDGPTSLPSFGQNSNIYSFEVGSSSSSYGNSVSSLTRSNSVLSFASKSKNFYCGKYSSSSSSDCWSRKTSSQNTGSGSRTHSPSCLNTPRGGSSSSLGSSCQEKRILDWSRLVENVFKEEIGKLAKHIHGGQTKK
eukprot:GFUD01084722.1.p1 GENE.GFUD01084722.1~~GFUD01084722.1.p1  ORF type:complete len:192 (+),score=45.10 GFUD01084722.1:23-598(+)